MTQPGERLGINPEGMEIWFQWLPDQGSGEFSVPVVTALDDGRWAWQVIVPVPQLLGLMDTLRARTQGFQL